MTRTKVQQNVKSVNIYQETINSNNNSNSNSNTNTTVHTWLWYAEKKTENNKTAKRCSFSITLFNFLFFYSFISAFYLKWHKNETKQTKNKNKKMCRKKTSLSDWKSSRNLLPLAYLTRHTHTHTYIHTVIYIVIIFRSAYYAPLLWTHLKFFYFVCFTSQCSMQIFFIVCVSNLKFTLYYY